ncbi:hypothetical protein D3C71_1456590 [compost metagenome]
MAQILARQQPHPARTRVADHRQLEIDQRRRAVFAHQPIGLLGQVVVCDAVAMHLLQQPSRRAEVGQIAMRRTLVHGVTGHETAVQPAPVPAQQPRRGRHAIQMRQRARLTPCQPPRRQPQPPGRGLQITAYEAMAVLFHQQDAAETVGFEGGRRGIGRACHAAILGG